MRHLPSQVGVPLKTELPTKKPRPDDEKPAKQASSLTPVDTPAGVAEVLVELPPARSAAVRSLLMLGHGAGGEIDAPDLATLSRAALGCGIAVARVRQPYRVLGRRAPAPAPHLDAAWLAVAAALRDASGPFTPARRRLRGLPIVFAGRSSGARVACRTAADGGAAAVLGLAFPLHPPGKPERSRAAELEVGVPLLVLQGARDAFGKPAEFPDDVEVVEVAGSDHGLKSADFDAAAAAATRWILEL